VSGPDPRIWRKIQIDMFRPIRLDHTNCLQVGIVSHTLQWRCAECFQSAGHEALQDGVDDSVFFELALNELQGVCGHPNIRGVCGHDRTYVRIREYKHHSTDVCVSTATHTHHSLTRSLCMKRLVMFPLCSSYR
jgi:hypothetical protein